MPTILFDVSRLYIRASLTSPTGIDRVTEAYLTWLIERGDVRVIPVCTWGGWLWRMSLGRTRQILRRKLRASRAAAGTWRDLLAALEAPAVQARELRAQRQAGEWRKVLTRYLPAALRTLSGWRPLPIPPGALYINVSHFGLEQPDLLDRVAAAGAKTVVMIHDLIPIIHPEFCSPKAAGLHHRRIDAVLDRAGLVITNSAATAGDLRIYASRTSRRLPPVCVAPLGLEPVFFDPKQAPVRGAPYFVCVGTIEPRKNIAFLLRIWRRLADQLGDRTPALVLVGQRGWETEWILDLLERSPPVLKYVHEAPGLDDEQLASLLMGARALLAPSLIEGFNLPVSEAVALGVPVIASDIPAHRELAVGATLIDPLDGPGWLDAIEAATASRAPRRPRRRDGWPEHFELVGQALGLDGPFSAGAAPQRRRAERMAG